VLFVIKAAKSVDASETESLFGGDVVPMPTLSADASTNSVPESKLTSSDAARVVKDPAAPVMLPLVLITTSFAS